MMRRLPFVLLFAAATAPAATTYPNFMNGVTLMESCEPEYHFECTDYIKGFSDLHNNLRAGGLVKELWCAPPKTTAAQLRQALLTYGEAHRDELNQPGSTLVIKALQKAFPCGAGAETAPAR